MSKRIFIDGSIDNNLCIIGADGQEINYFDYSDNLASSKKNNIYLGTVSRVEPSLQAAFVDYGNERHGFLAFSEIHPDYFQIPIADKQDIISKEVSKVNDNDSIDENIEENEINTEIQKHKIGKTKNSNTPLIPSITLASLGLSRSKRSPATT